MRTFESQPLNTGVEAWVFVRPGKSLNGFGVPAHDFGDLIGGEGFHRRTHQENS